MKHESALFEQLSVLIITQRQIQCDYVKQNQKLMTRIVVRVQTKIQVRAILNSSNSDSVGVRVNVQGTYIFKVGKWLLSTSAINFPNYCQRVGKPLTSCAKNNLSTTAAASGMSRNNTCRWRMCGYFKFFLTLRVTNMKMSEINETPRLGLYVARFFTSTAWWLYPSCLQTTQTLESMFFLQSSSTRSPQPSCHPPRLPNPQTSSEGMELLDGDC